MTEVSAWLREDLERRRSGKPVEPSVKDGGTPGEELPRPPDEIRDMVKGNPPPHDCSKQG